MCPCKECLVMASCRLKSYSILIVECDKIRKYLSVYLDSDGRKVGNIDQHHSNVPTFEKTLKPVKWKVGAWHGNMYDLKLLSKEKQ